MRPSTIRQFVLAAVAVATAAPPVGAQPTVEEVRAAWAKRQDTVRSLRATWTTKSTTPKGALSFLPPRPGANLPAVFPDRDMVHDGDVELLLEQDKSRLTMRGDWLDGDKGVFFRSQVVSVFDGKTFTMLKGPERLGHPTAVSKVTDHNIVADISVVPMLTATRGLNPSVARLSLAEYTQARHINEGNRRLVVLSRPRDETSGEATMWLDPAQDYAPVRAETYNRDGKLTSKVIAVYSRSPGGVACWLPERWTASGWIPAGKLARQVEVTVRHREVNVETSPTDFDLTLPAGTAFSEQGDKKTEHSIVRADGSKRLVLPSERDLSYDELVRTDPGPSPWGVRPWVWWVCGAGGVLCAGSVALLLRRRPRSASEGVVPPSS